jgi:putative NADH-flavin reductase
MGRTCNDFDHNGDTQIRLPCRCRQALVVIASRLVKLTIFGATGGVGLEVLRQALAADWHVTAVARNPAKLPADVDAVQADLADSDAGRISQAVHMADAVISAVGPARRADVGIAARATAAIANAMTVQDVGRLVVISASPVGVMPSPHRPDPPRYDPGDDPLMRYVIAPMILRMFPDVYRDLAAMEDLLRGCQLLWTAIRPPRLTNGPLTGTYRTAIDRNLPKGRTISRADVAQLMVNVLQQPETIRHTVGIAY